mgnify:CR=1 FL=1
MISIILVYELFDKMIYYCNNNPNLLNVCKMKITVYYLVAIISTLLFAFYVNILDIKVCIIIILALLAYSVNEITKKQIENIINIFTSELCPRPKRLIKLSEMSVKISHSIVMFGFGFGINSLFNLRLLPQVELLQDNTIFNATFIVIIFGVFANMGWGVYKSIKPLNQKDTI